MTDISPFLDGTDHPASPPAPKPSTPQREQSRYTGKVVPVTLMTGYLGAGKTTIIINVIKSLPATYRVAWLKNEVGNTAVDSELAAQAGVATVKEIVKGCLCHYMLGSLNAALEDILQSRPDRIIIETSGSAAPAPIVWEIRKNPHLRVDGVITVIDAVNFTGYVNKSYALRMQAKYTDLILINKHEGLDERTLEENLDDLYDINLDTPKIKTRRGHIDPDIIFGLDSTLFLSADDATRAEQLPHDHHLTEVELVEFAPTQTYDVADLRARLRQFPKAAFYRIKGIVRVIGGTMAIINYAFGDVEITSLAKDVAPRVVCMGENLMTYRDCIMETFHVAERDLRFTPKGHHQHDHHDHA